MSKLAPVTLKGSAPLSPAEASLVEDVVASRPRGWWSRFRHGVALAAKVVTREEFDRVCLRVLQDLDGATVSPEDASATATRVIAAYTQAQATVHMPKCTCCDLTMMVAWLGEPRSGFLFTRHLKLIDPKGAHRG